MEWQFDRATGRVGWGGLQDSGGGGTHRSWPGGQGGRGLGGRRGWMAVPKKRLVGCFKKKKWQGVGSPRPLGPRLGLGGGSKGFGAGGVGGRGTGANYV